MACIIGGMAILVILIIFGSQMVIFIQTGERGVIFRPYTSGLDNEHIYGEGYHIIATWNTMNIYNVREKSEAERRRIEADGLAAYILIVNSSFTGNILKQKEIDEPIELAKSSNSKIVVVGNGNESLPLIVANN